MTHEDAIDFVSIFYRALLGREADTGGLEKFVAALLAGQTLMEVAEQLMQSDEYRRLQGAKLFVPPGHFYSPIVNPDEIESWVTANRQHVPSSLPGLRLDRERMLQLWSTLLPYMITAPFSEKTSRGSLYNFQNHSYSWGDGSVLHAMLRHLRPRQLIEVGSGWSSACTIDTVRDFLGGQCNLTFIEPYPELLFGILGELRHTVRVMQQPVQTVALTEFGCLQANDILFIDSTHVLRTGNDVWFELFEILPRLARGVVVHFHDIFWPFEYPENWIMEENRSWNEIYALRALLTGNDDWDILMFNDFLARTERTLIDRTFPNFLRNTGGALWLQRT